MEILAKQIIELSQTATHQLNQRLGNYIKPKKLPAVRNEFLFLFLHLFNRRVFSRFSEQEGQNMQDSLQVILLRSDKSFKEKTFWEKCSEREIEYAPCKELMSRERFFSSKTATISVFVRHIANELGSPANPEIILRATEVAVKSVRELQQYFSDYFTEESMDEIEASPKKIKQLTNEGWCIATKCHKCGDIKYSACSKLIRAVVFLTENWQKNTKCPKCRKKARYDIHIMKI